MIILPYLEDNDTSLCEKNSLLSKDAWLFVVFPLISRLLVETYCMLNIESPTSKLGLIPSIAY
jgi:hypothetical protein